MKLIIMNDSLISLEDVRRVDIITNTSHHTSYGSKYETKHYSINIAYTDGAHENIKCGEDDNGRNVVYRYLDEIYCILANKKEVKENA